MSERDSEMMSMARWAAGGLLFTVNAFIAGRLVSDGGFVASVSALIAVILVLVPMMRILLADLRQRRMRMHELAIVAVFASCLQGDFQTSALIALFMLLAMMIEQRTASGAQASLEALAKITPGKIRKLASDGTTVMCESTEVAPGDRMRILPGENIMADGIVRKGRSSVDEANVTGESLPIDKNPDAEVFAGTTNLSGALEVEITRAGKDTTIGKVRELIERAHESRLSFSRVVDQYVAYYTPFVLVVAGTVLFFTRGAEDSLERVVALLVVTCPIAIILATPASVVAALSAAARVGVLFKDIGDLEALTRMDAMVFDKTGTLTTGDLEVSKLAPVEGIDTTGLMRAAVIAESASNHPVAQAVMRLAKKVNLEPVHPDQLHEEPGRGVKATVGGRTIIAGNLAWMVDNKVLAEQFPRMAEVNEMGASILFLAEDGKALGWIAVADTVRTTAKAVIAELHESGVRHTAIVSGDRRQVVESVADELGVSARKSECTPADKVTYVEKAKEEGYHVIFVGDGVNDAPALVNSHIGIAMGAAGSDVALDSASIALMNSKLNRLPFLLQLSRTMKRTVIQNFVLGSLIILVGVALSAAGSLSPMLASILQVFGAMVVALNSARLIRQGETLDLEQ